MFNPAAINQTAISSFNSFLSFLQKLSFAYYDLLDILIVAVLIFFVLLLFRRTKTTPIIFGIFLLGLLYILSISLNLRLTQTIFSALLGIVVIVLAIIFQKELRRFFELIGIIGLKRKIYPPTEAIFKIISRTVESLTKNKLGAIIILPGNENIERHLTGGITLDGKVSRPLLLSIFDKSSPGHDGAVVIENERIKKFAVHLPLAENAEYIKKYGTRHRAALGLAERTDALIIVVSEEKGTISVARHAKISLVNSIEELEKILREFFERTFPQKTIDIYKKWLKTNASLLAISLVAATSLWILFTYQTSLVQRKFTVPVQFKNIAPEHIIEDYVPEDIVVIFSGWESDFKLLENQTLQASIDLSNIKPGWHKIIIKKEQISYPAALSIVKIEPESIKVHIGMSSE